MTRTRFIAPQRGSVEDACAIFRGTGSAVGQTDVLLEKYCFRPPDLAPSHIQHTSGINVDIQQDVADPVVSGGLQEQGKRKRSYIERIEFL